jgi:hypothetical protein
MPDSPIGSVIAYAGEVTRAWERQNGWLRCDGRQLDNTQPDNVALFKAIGFAWGGDGDSMFNVPDLQGFFLRGVDDARDRKPEPDMAMPFPVDPDRNERIQYRLGGNKGNKVGSVQLFATALPQGAGNEFVAEKNGQHHHQTDFQLNASRDVNGQNNTVAYPWIPPGPQPPYTTEAGAHTHQIIGGNKETRPVNAYVHWIIRYR